MYKAQSSWLEAISDRIRRKICQYFVAIMRSVGMSWGHTQLGNNNAYCQDSPLTWLNWDLAPEQRELL